MFPTMNAKTQSRQVHLGTSSSATAVLEQLTTGPMNLFSVPGVVDVSGMEFSIGVYDSTSGAAGLAAQTGSVLQVTFSDGGPSGDNTAVAVLFTALTNTVAWTETIPRDAAGSSATDLDADDWVNFHYVAKTATIPGIGMADAVAHYVYGKPGAIN